MPSMPMRVFVLAGRFVRVLMLAMLMLAMLMPVVLMVVVLMAVLIVRLHSTCIP